MLYDNELTFYDSKDTVSKPQTSPSIILDLQRGGNAMPNPYFCAVFSDPSATAILQLNASDNPDMSNPIALIMTNPGQTFFGRLPRRIRRYLQVTYSGTINGTVDAFLTKDVPSPALLKQDNIDHPYPDNT